MSATYRTSVAGGDTAGTGNRSVAITPVVGDLFVVFVSLSVNVAALEVTDDNGIGGTYTRLMSGYWGSSANNAAVFVRNALLPNTNATTITCVSGANDAGVIVAVAVSGMTRVGLSAARSMGFGSDQTAGTPPTAVLNQSALTGNMTLIAVASGDTTSTPPASWTERQDASQATPTTALEVATRDSGFTGTTIAYSATQDTTYAVFALELDGSAPAVPQTETILKSYFETGDQPTQTQFEEFIGTMFYLYQLAQNTAVQASDNADDAVSHAPLAMVTARYVSGTAYTLDSQQNIASIQTRRVSDSVLDNVGNLKLRFNFTTPIVDANYVLALTPMSATQAAQQINLISKTVDYFEIQIGPASSGSNIIERIDLVLLHV